MKNKAGISLTELQKKVRKHFCALVDYGMKTKELYLLSGYYSWDRVENRIKKCKGVKL